MLSTFYTTTFTPLYNFKFTTPNLQMVSVPPQYMYSLYAYYLYWCMCSFYMTKSPVLYSHINYISIHKEMLNYSYSYPPRTFKFEIHFQKKST